MPRVNIPVNGTNTVTYLFSEGFAGMWLRSMTAQLNNGAAGGNPVMFLRDKTGLRMVDWPGAFVDPVGTMVIHTWQTNISSRNIGMTDVLNPFVPFQVDEGDTLFLVEPISAANVWVDAYITLSPL